MSQERKRLRRASEVLWAKEFEIACSLCESIDSPRSLAIWLLLTYGEFDQVAEMGIDPLHYCESDWRKFRDDYQVTKLLSKSKVMPTTFDRTKRAFDKWVDAENLCKLTNDRLMDPNTDRQVGMDSNLSLLVHRTRVWVHRILGRLTETRLGYVQDAARFGPGTTLSVSRSRLSRGNKYRPKTITASRDMAGLFMFSDFFGGLKERRKATSVMEVVDSDRLEFVPKDAKVDRPISIGPHLNIFYQLGVGALIRRRLRAWGYDLSNQAETNRGLASAALERGLATVDLSSASDTVAYQTVKALLPPDWFQLLELGRIQYTRLPDNSVRALEKYSGMGNGYTFELETLLFLAMALASQGEHPDWANTSVFGDDIILPSESSSNLLLLLAHYGFKVNREKTFLTGVFYESCGKDYFAGREVRPFFLRKDPNDSTFATQVFQYCNGISQIAYRSLGGLGRDSRFRAAYNQALRGLPQRYRHLAAPNGDCDTGLWRNKAQWFGAYHYSRLQPVVGYTQRETIGQYLASLHRGSSFTYGRDPVPLMGVPEEREVRDTTFEWVSPGQWY